jgi:hypothetical protein
VTRGKEKIRQAIFLRFIRDCGIPLGVTPDPRTWRVMRVFTDQVGDHHPDDLVHSSDYLDPLPGWSVLRPYFGKIPVLLRVGFAYPHEVVYGPSATFHHPDPVYVREVARQLVCNRRTAYRLDVTGNHLDRCNPDLVVISRMGPDGVHPEPESTEYLTRADWPEDPRLVLR